LLLLHKVGGRESFAGMDLRDVQTILEIIGNFIEIASLLLKFLELIGRERGPPAGNQFLYMDRRIMC
jgi:hypothetical protein